MLPTAPLTRIERTAKKNLARLAAQARRDIALIQKPLLRVNEVTRAELRASACRRRSSPRWLLRGGARDPRSHRGG